MNALPSNDSTEYVGDEISVLINTQTLINSQRNGQCVAELAHSTWRHIDEALAPVIGARGVIALYKRSLRLAQAEYPWLTDVHDATHLPSEFFALRSALLQQSEDKAVAASAALQQIFYGLLSSFIGNSLTRELLASVFRSNAVNEFRNGYLS